MNRNLTLHAHQILGQKKVSQIQRTFNVFKLYDLLEGQG
jgi:hypothetical protein